MRIEHITRRGFLQLTAGAMAGAALAACVPAAPSPGESGGGAAAPAEEVELAVWGFVNLIEEKTYAYHVTAIEGVRYIQGY